MAADDDQFQVWLMDMEDAIGRFLQSIPTETAARLDYSPESLDVIERHALGTYATIDDIKKRSEAKTIDGMARYVGQVFRKHFGGSWIIDVSDRKNTFHGLPQLSGMKGQRTASCPLTLVTASTDRRTGRFIRTVFENYRQRIAQAPE
ncbi:hypothetical protein FBZ89_103409 [Nitrospirillum amazonense]|uniref:Uncharacterized protein n=1 Tax=Nitrospirillum amazonense TaxID=28077 RepID=A0A560FMC7_9PROT|nr:hypothetical protein [Nitrospirillum amazonense]TWB22779.1 hypothetical protein FBZ89_103409 [Nitrospirillum amazonense]